MLRHLYKAAAADLLLLVALYYVLADLAWRTYYAGTPHAGLLQGYSPTFSYSLLTRTFTMGGRGVTLVSPPTFDWVQALVCFLIIVNAWFVYANLKSRGVGRTETRLGAATA